MQEREERNEDTAGGTEEHRDEERTSDEELLEW